MTWESSFTSEPSLSGVFWNVLECINPPFSRDMAWSRKSLWAERPAYNTLTWNIIISSLTWTSQSFRDNLSEHSLLTLNIRASGISVPLTRSVPLKMFFIICHIRVKRVILALFSQEHFHAFSLLKPSWSCSPHSDFPPNVRSCPLFSVHSKPFCTCPVALFLFGTFLLFSL